MDLEIDVSGSDIFDKNYTILVAEPSNSTMLGYKFSSRIQKIIRSKHGQGQYRYSTSKKGKSDLKVRLYCVSIYFIFKELKRRHNLKKVFLRICRDFSGNEADIKEQLKQLLKKLKIETEIIFEKLSGDSVADRYAFLIRKDTKNLLAKHCIEIELDEFEAFLKH